MDGEKENRRENETRRRKLIMKKLQYQFVGPYAWAIIINIIVFSMCVCMSEGYDLIISNVVSVCLFVFLSHFL